LRLSEATVLVALLRCKLKRNRRNRKRVNYCRTQINLSVTHHGGYLTCQNMVNVTGHKGVLTKGLNRDNHPNMVVLAQIWVSYL